MASWLSSKLKVAEQLLQQIDQQAAESLRKPEKPGPHPASLREQFDRDSEDYGRPSWGIGNPGREQARQQQPQQQQQQQQQQRTLSGLKKAGPVAPRTRQEHAARPDQDWTQLLASPASSPGATTPFASSVGSCDPGSGRDGARRSGPTPTSKAVPVSSLKQIAAQSSRVRQAGNGGRERRQGSDAAASVKNFRDESVKRRLDLEGIDDVGEEQALRVLVAEDAASGVGGSVSWSAAADGRDRLGLGHDVASSAGGEGRDGVSRGVRDDGIGRLEPVVEEAPGLERPSGVEDLLDDALRRATVPVSKQYGVHAAENAATTEDLNGFVDLELEPTLPEPVPETSGRRTTAVNEQAQAQEAGIIINLPSVSGRGYEAEERVDVESLSGSGSESGSESRSESGSESGSDSEYEDEVRRKAAERRKLRKQRELESLAVEAARAALAERENLVQQLECEKEALERALADGVEQQVKEAAELQLSMMEVAQALELERRQHSRTRMEGLALEAHLEAENADLTRALAAAQRDVEEQLSKVLETSSRVEAKRMACNEVERKIATLHHRQRQRNLSHQVELAAPDELENSLREQQVELAWKIQQRQAEVKDLETKINIIMDTSRKSTDLEVELQGRLNQLTDQLIQKQAQVESLATEKATLVFRLEAISNNLREEKSAALSRATKRNTKGMPSESDYEDPELGPNRPYSSKDKGWLPAHEPRSLQWLSIFQQIDHLFLGGAQILRRHGAARAIAATYLLLLHGWVLFVVFMKSHREDLSLPVV